jgi:hypothetical protein
LRCVNGLLTFICLCDFIFTCDPLEFERCIFSVWWGSLAEIPRPNKSERCVFVPHNEGARTLFCEDCFVAEKLKDDTIMITFSLCSNINFVQEISPNSFIDCIIFFPFTFFPSNQTDHKVRKKKQTGKWNSKENKKVHHQQTITSQSHHYEKKIISLEERDKDQSQVVQSNKRTFNPADSLRPKRYLQSRWIPHS